MIRRSTWIILGVFLLLLCALLIYQKINKTESTDVASNMFSDLGTLEPVSLLFKIPEAEVYLGLRIEDNFGSTLEMKRRNENEDWVFIDLEAEPDQEAINRVISQLATISIDQTLDTNLDPEVIGLTDPKYTLQVSVSNGGIFTLYIGDLTITNTSYYAQLAGFAPVVVDKYALDTAINLLSSIPIKELETPTPESGGSNQ